MYILGLSSPSTSGDSHKDYVYDAWKRRRKMYEDDQSTTKVNNWCILQDWARCQHRVTLITWKSCLKKAKKNVWRRSKGSFFLVTLQGTWIEEFEIQVFFLYTKTQLENNIRWSAGECMLTYLLNHNSVILFFEEFVVTAMKQSI